MYKVIQGENAGQNVGYTCTCNVITIFTCVAEGGSRSSNRSTPSVRPSATRHTLAQKRFIRFFSNFSMLLGLMIPGSLSFFS